jgi:hypothetical protein
MAGDDAASAKIVSSNMAPKSRDKKKAPKAASTTPSVNTDDPGAPGQSIPSFHKGGKVRKTGLARLKKGERVLTRKQQRSSRSRR